MSKRTPEEQLVTWLDRKIREARESISTFSEKLAKAETLPDVKIFDYQNRVKSLFEGVGNQITAAARLQIYSEVHHYLTNPEHPVSYADVVEHIRGRVLESNMYEGLNTNPAVNLMKRAEGAAWATLCDYLKWCL